MKTSAAIMWEVGQPWSVEEIDLDPPRAGEVLVRYEASGLCHSDDHIRTGDVPASLPMVGGHEGAGVVEEVGTGVTRFEAGDHVVTSFIPSCGYCRWCASGQSNLCDLGAMVLEGAMADGSYRRHARGQGIGAMCLVGSFAQHATVMEASLVKIDDHIPLDRACLVGCGVTTGWGSAVNSAQTAPGDTVVVIGVGGIGGGAIQGARIAGAAHVVAVDIVEHKRDQALSLGATHFASSFDEARALVSDLTLGVMADSAILTVGVVQGSMIAPMLDMVRKAGRGVVTGIASFADMNVSMSLFTQAMYQKTLVGSLFGACNPRVDVPRLLRLYQNGQLKLDEMVTTEYKLADVNLGYEDMLRGANIRGIVRCGS